MKHTAKLSIGLAAGIVISAVVLQLLARRNEPSTERVSVGLTLALPNALPNWITRDELLGPTESAQGTIKNILNYDEYVYRVYLKGQTEVGVYVAFWAPGRMPTRMIQQHTPDRCWTENGWECKSAVFDQSLVFNGKPFLPAQGRVFTPPGGKQPTYVRFWLLVSGHNYDFGDSPNIMPNPFRWWGQFIKELVFGYEEHYFIRLTSNRPFEEIQDDPGFQEVLSALAKLGLAASPSEVGERSIL